MNYCICSVIQSQVSVSNKFCGETWQLVASLFHIFAELGDLFELQMFYSPTETRPMQSEELFESFRGCIECQQPITDLYRFVGRINIYDVRGNSETQPLSAENVLLRGSRLKNTPYVYGSCSFVNHAADHTICLLLGVYGNIGGSWTTC